MGRADKIIIAISILIGMAFGVIAFSAEKINGSEASSQKKAIQNVLLHANSANEARSASSSAVANEDFYQKLRDGQSIKILVLGDDTVSAQQSSDSDNWINLLTEKLHTAYKATFNVTYAPQIPTNVAEGFIQYEKLRSGSDSQYDLIFLSFGQYDQSKIDLNTFHLYYDRLLNQLMTDQPKAAIFPVVEYALGKSNGFLADIQQLTAYYGLTAVDIAGTIGSKQNGKSGLSSDSVHLNSVGDGWIADEVYDQIKQDVESKKTSENTQKAYCYSDTDDVKDANLITSPSKISGYQDTSSIYLSSNANDTLSFNCSGSVILLYYQTNPSGGTAQIYCDDQYEGNLDTKSSSTAYSLYRIQAKLTSGNHTVKLVTRKASVDVVGVLADPYK